MDMLANLQAFVASADRGGFSAAARQLGVVPSVLSKRVDQLEWRIQASLFTRSTRKLALTDVGERYLPVVRDLLRQVDDTLGGMARSSGAIEGHLRIKIPTTLGSLYLSQLLHAFLRQQPMISMDIMLVDRSVNPVEEGFDVAIGALPELYGQVRDIPLCPLKRRLCASPAYLAARATPQQPTDLLDHPCLVFSTSGERWEFQSEQGLTGVTVRPKMRTNDGRALRDAVVAGDGIAILADYLAQEPLRTGELVEVMADYAVPDIWLKALVPFERYDLPRVRMLLAWLELHLKAQTPWLV
jgi:DNA-binding transcriptional LysR family regulator